MSHAWFHSVADRLSQPVFLLSTTAEVRAVNAAGASATQGGAAAGTAFAPLTQRPEATARYLALAARSGGILPGALQFEGSGREWRCDAGAVRFDGGQYVVLHLRPHGEAVAQFLLLNRQIERLQREIARRQALEAEREELLASEQAARALAEQANLDKDHLLASISHELRTPLNAIAGWVELMRQDLGDAERLRRGLEVIERNVAAETQLANDLVDTAMILTRRMKLQPREVNLESVVRDAVDSAQPVAARRQQRIEVLAESGCVVQGDPDRLLQVVNNLLSNALKYSDDGCKVQLSLRRINSHAELRVSDQGQGIAPELLPFLFDRFTRGDASATRSHGGLGLGLAIARHLVELHGGLVRAESEGPGCGSTFVVDIPLPIFSQQQAVAQEQRASTSVTGAGPESSLAGLRVLLVEDHDDSREMLRDIIASRGAQVVEAMNSAQAQQQFAEHSFDLVISDIEMPQEDGFTFMRKLRAQERGRAAPSAPPVPAIAVTAHHIPDARLHALQAGFQGFLVKPVHVAELVALIRSLCPRRAG